MFKKLLSSSILVCCLLNASCLPKSSSQQMSDPHKQSVRTANEELERATAVIRAQQEELSDLNWNQSQSSSLSSRFNCRSAIRAASAAHDVYPITMEDVIPEEIASRHRSQDFAVFNASTGKVGREVVSRRGFVEYIPSELETALENTPDVLPEHFVSLNTHRQLVLAFRGTIGGFQEPDWRTNRDIAPSDASRLNPGARGQIHRGFLRAYLSAQQELTQYFEQTFMQKSQRLADQLRARLVRSGLYTSSSINRYIDAVLGDYQVLITGHSLGGALATLAAYDFALTYEPYREKLSLITFAAPASLFGLGPEHSYHQFSHLMARGTQFGNQHSAIFFERDGDIVHEDTARENYTLIGSALAVLLYHGNAAPFPGRPENSGLAVKMDSIPNQSIFSQAINFATRAVTGGMLNANFLAAHSMELYKNDIHQYCDDMDLRQRCLERHLEFNLLSDEEQRQCESLGMSADQSARYRRDLEAAGKTHIMDHREFERISHRDFMLISGP